MNDVIKTKQADCKDCYRCLRACPVKAISFKEHQACVEAERCILCGICVVECPQKAKLISNQSELVEKLLAMKAKVALSLAPSFPASFSGPAQDSINSLQQSGFAIVEETAVGAAYTVAAYQEQINQQSGKTMLSSCCPVIVNLVEKYYPSLIGHLMPVASPMVAHARYLHSVYGDDTKVVFAGPCIAKLREAEENGLTALTFVQLKELLDKRQAVVDAESIITSAPTLPTRAFAISQGVLLSMDIPEERRDDYWSVDGIDRCREVLDALQSGEIQPVFIELMACPGGCVGGPAAASPFSLYKRKNRIREFHHQTRAASAFSPDIINISLARNFKAAAYKEQEFTEEQIREVLAKMGKYMPEDERNCEGCGYKSCRDKAIAVLRGLAVTEMCIPYMRSKAESLANAIVESTPSAILVLDPQMRVQEYNTAAVQMFPDIPWVKGLELSQYLDTELYQQVLDTQVSFIEQKSYFEQGNLITRQMITPLQQKGMVMAIITDITQFEQSRLHYNNMKEDITTKAREVIKRQMMVAQSIAGLLGETTAETKAAMLELLAQLESDKF